jgi:hypothetical protein
MEDKRESNLLTFSNLCREWGYPYGIALAASERASISPDTHLTGYYQRFIPKF